MWEADFGAVNEAIAEGFEEGERRVVVWVEEDVFFDVGLLKLVLEVGEEGMGGGIDLEGFEVVHGGLYGQIGA